MRTKVAKKLRAGGFVPMPQILWSRTLHIWPFPLLKHTHTLGQRKSSTTINKAAAAARERESERKKKQQLFSQTQQVK